MDLLHLDELQNLQDLKQLEEMENLQKLDRLDQLQQLPQLKHMDQLQHIESLDKLRPLDQLQHIESLDKLHVLDQLQHLDKLSNLQVLNKLQNLSVMNNLHYLNKLQHIDHLQQLRMLNQLGKLQELSRLQNMQTLKNLSQMQSLNELSQLNHLQYMENLRQLHSLQSLQQLEVLNRLSLLNKLLAFNFISLLYLLSIIIPGLVFQETITLLGPARLDLKRALVLLAIYNVINLILCISFGFNFLEQFSNQRPMYYAGWFFILILFPVIAGSLVALLAKVPPLGRLSTHLTGMHRQAANAWERFLTDAENYQVVITLNNEEKLMGVFHRGESAPKTDDPLGMYFTETAHYNPHSKEWEDLKHPVSTWVKGSEIKIVELSSES